VNRLAIVVSALTAVIIIAVLAAFGWVIWSELSVQGRNMLTQLAPEVGAKLAIALILAFLAAIAAIRWISSAYATPLKILADDVRMIALGNSQHQLTQAGPAEVRALVTDISIFAERFEAVQSNVKAQIHESAAALEEERDTLAALTAKLAQGVVICSLGGRILFYNHQAQGLLKGPKRLSGGGDLIGLGRSVYSVIEESMIRHALMSLVHARQRGEAPLLVPFIVNREGGDTLNVHLVPISGKRRHWHGYILTLEDVTRRITNEMRRAKAFQALIQEQRAAVGSIRAGIEAVLEFPDMEEQSRQSFLEMVHGEVLDLSRRFEGLEDNLSKHLDDRWTRQDVLASDLIAAVERHVQDALGLKLEMSVPVEPLYLRVDRYAIARSMIFLIEQVLHACRAESLALVVEARSTSAILQLSWKGAVLHKEALHSWGKRNVLTELPGSSMTLFEVIERHSGAIWPHRSGPDLDTRPAVQLLLPLGDANEVEAATIPQEMGQGHEFDLRLSDQAARSGSGAETPLSDLMFTVIDTETTGMRPDKGDEIIAIGAVRVVNGRVLSREVFDSFVHPSVPISPESEAVHGISISMLRGQPPMAEVFPDLRRFIDETIIVGYSIEFDLAFFRIVEADTGIRLDNPFLDVLLLENLVMPSKEGKGLDEIAERLGISVTGRHTALGDAMTTAEVLIALMPLLQQKGIRTLGQAIEACAASNVARPRL